MSRLTRIPAFPTLLLAQPREGVGVTDGNLHCPAIAILCEDVLRAQGELGREKRLDRWGWFAVARTCGAALALTPYDHNLQEAPRQHRVPQAIPGLDLGTRFARVRLPALRGLRQGFGCSFSGLLSSFLSRYLSQREVRDEDV